MRISFAVLAVAALVSLPGVASSLSVTSTSPSRYALGVSPALTTITVEFDSAPTIPDAAAVRVAGMMSGLHAGTISVVANTLTFTNADPWMVGEIVHVNLRGDIHTGASFLTGGHVFAFTIASGLSGVEWSAPQIYASGNVPYFIYGGDLDEDGTPDVAAPCEQSDAVAVHLNKEGTGHFPEFDLHDVGAVPSSVFGEDFDNDGDVDLATADIADGTVSVLLNNGDGTFAPKTTYSAGLVNCRQIHGGDFDGDNDVDLCATSYGTGVVYLYWNGGAGLFTSTTYGDVANGPFAIRTGDLDGDGHLDIAVACQTSDSLSVVINQGSGVFTTTGRYRIGDGPWCLNGNDFDADGDFDLASVASFGNRIVFLRNDGTGAYPLTLRQAAVTEPFPLGVYVADFDGDGDIDGASSNYSGASIQTYLNDGAGTFALQTTLDTQSSGSYTWAHDLDGDGDLDLSVVDEVADLLFIFYNEPATGVDPPVAGVGASEIAVAPNPMIAGTKTTILLAGMPGVDGAVAVEIFDVAGRRVRTLGTEGGTPSVTWDGRNESGSAVSAGVYMIRANAMDRELTTTVRVLR